MKEPLVSVIMPAYQGELYIKNAIASILNQTYTNFELIIIEDASTDRTRQIIDEFSDKRIRKYYHQENKGISYSTNEGISLSNGKYIAFLDDDDEAFEDRLKLQVQFLENNPNIDILGGRVISIDENGNTILDWGVPRNNGKYIRCVLMFRMVDFCHGTLMVRKDFFDRTGIRYREKYIGMQDFQFLIEASKITNITTIPEYLLKSRVHSTNETLKQRKVNTTSRESLYKKMQRESIQANGFELSESQLILLNDVFQEDNRKCRNIHQFIELCEVFEEMVRQAEDGQFDFCNELKLYLVRALQDVLRYTNSF